MSAHITGGWSLLAALRERADTWYGRAAGRGAAASLIMGGLAGSLMDASDTVPGSSDRMVDLGAAAGSAIALIMLARWVGSRDIGFGLKLTAISWLFFQELLAAATIVWIAAGISGDPPDWPFLAVATAVNAALMFFTVRALRRLDPDF